MVAIPFSGMFFVLLDQRRTLFIPVIMGITDQIYQPKCVTSFRSRCILNEPVFPPFSSPCRRRAAAAGGRGAEDDPVLPPRSRASGSKRESFSLIKEA